MNIQSHQVGEIHKITGFSVDQMPSVFKALAKLKKKIPEFSIQGDVTADDSEGEYISFSVKTPVNGFVYLQEAIKKEAGLVV